MSLRLPETLRPFAERLRHPPSRCLFWAVMALFLVVALPLVNDARGRVATQWMNIYHPSDFETPGEAFAFVADLRVPIPPLLALGEILNHQHDGTTHWVSRGLYRTALVLAYLAALAVAATSVGRLLLALAVSVVFLWSTVVVHPGNSQVYDLLLPACFLGWTLCLLRARDAVRPGARLALAAAAGACLALADLMRPFVVLLLPLLAIGSALALWHGTQGLCTRARRETLACLLLPLVLLSGSWHAHLLSRHGQLTATNHSGFNLQRSWKMVPLPAFVYEPDRAPLAPDRWPNLNTPEHAENSRRLRRAIARHALANPVEAARHVLVGFGRLLAPQTAIYSHRPEHPVLALYRPLVWATALWLALQVALVAVRTLRRRPDRLAFASAPPHLLMGSALACLTVFAVGDHREEARFLISVLPMLAALCAAADDTATGAARRSPASAGTGPRRR